MAAMRLAVEQSQAIKGATYPNPPVGAVILDSTGNTVESVPPSRLGVRTPRWSPCEWPVSVRPVAPRW